MKDFYFSKCFSLIGFLMILIAIGLYFSSDYMLKHQVNQVNIESCFRIKFYFYLYFFLWKNVILKNNSAAFEIWLHPPAKILRKYYIFDVINTAEIEAGTAKPKVNQRGPYVYSKEIIHLFIAEKLVQVHWLFTLYSRRSMGKTKWRFYWSRITSFHSSEYNSVWTVSFKRNWRRFGYILKYTSCGLLRNYFSL